MIINPLERYYFDRQRGKAKGQAKKQMQAQAALSARLDAAEIKNAAMEKDIADLKKEVPTP